MRDRKQLSGFYGQCAYNGLCGGRMYTAYFLTHGWLEPGPFCPYKPLSPPSFDS
jgi:MoaA/NifB/PqqE/SkfB family radical SAM enzyme